jgi:hypothetical protein
MRKYLEPNSNSLFDARYKEIEKERPVTVVDSLSRSYLKNFNLDAIKSVLRIVVQRHINNEYLNPPL